MAVVVLPGAFLHADVDEDVTMLLEVKLAKHMKIITLQVYQ